MPSTSTKATHGAERQRRMVGNIALTSMFGSQRGIVDIKRPAISGTGSLLADDAATSDQLDPNIPNPSTLASQLLQNRALVIALPCHREVANVCTAIRIRKEMPNLQEVSGCSGDFFSLLERSRTPAIIDMFNRNRNRERISFLITDVDVLTPTQTKELCQLLKQPRTEKDGCLLVAWPGIPKKSKALLPQTLIVESATMDDASASRVAARSILVERPPPTMKDHGELVPACERSLVGLLVHANMHLLLGPGTTPIYLEALDCTLMADSADKLSQAVNFVPMVELASMVRTVGVGQVLSKSSKNTLPRGELTFTKLLTAHATARTRLKAVRELCVSHRLTMREMAMAMDGDLIDAEATGVGRRAKAVLCE